MRAETYSMKAVAPTAAAILGLETPAASTEQPIDQIVNDLAGSERLAVLAPDALGILPWRLWRGEMPFLSSLHERRSILLQSIMPSITPVNFACMLTGAELEIHGMKTREMDFQCQTLYDVVRRAGGRSAGVGHKGYTGELMLARYADIPGVAEPGRAATVGEVIMRLTDREKPRFLIAQFGNVDTVMHKLGPSDSGMAPVLRECDQALARVVGHLTETGVAVILLADHGQHDIPDPAPGAQRGTHGSDSPEDCLVPCTWIK